MKYLVFGETIWDVYPDKNVIGGAAFNFSANSALLGEDVWFITGLGNDSLGDEAEEHIKNYGVKTDFICRGDKSTGRCIVSLDEKGIPSYNVLTDTAYDNITADDKLIDAIRRVNPDLFYINTLAQRNSVSRKALRTIVDSVKFNHIFCDINIREGCYDDDSIKFCLSRSDIIKISDEEQHYISDCLNIDAGTSFPDALSKAYPNLKLLVFTMGAKGSAVYDFEHGTSEFSGEPKKVQVVSTVGAGDCYSASFIHKYLSGAGISASIDFAAERSGIVVAHKEAIPQMFFKSF